MHNRPLQQQHPNMIACGILPGGAGGLSSSALNLSSNGKRRSVLQFRRSPSMGINMAKSSGALLCSARRPDSPRSSTSTTFPTKTPLEDQDDGGNDIMYVLPPRQQQQQQQQHLRPDAASSSPQLRQLLRANSAPMRPKGGGLCRTQSTVFGLAGGDILAASAAAGALEDGDEERSVSSTFPSSSSSDSSIASSSSAEEQSESLEPITGGGPEDAHDTTAAQHGHGHGDEHEEDAATYAQCCRNFATDLSRATQYSPPADVPHFDTPYLRSVMEPHVALARIHREQDRRKLSVARRRGSGSTSHQTSTSSYHHEQTEYRSISSSMGVPYTCLRGERPFLFDEHTFPLHEALADCLGVDDLSMLHDDIVQDKARLLGPLLDQDCRQNFHAQYDNFVTSFCIPLLHSMALQKGMFHASNGSSDRITYRYQAFPTLEVVRPGEGGAAPRCDTSRGHSIGSLRFHVPLTASVGTSALYAESHPGREDWHPLRAKSVGLGYLFDGARCLSFAPTNGTDRTRVSLDFRVLIYREKASPPMVMPRRGSASSFNSMGPRRDSEYDIAFSPMDPADDLSTLADADGGLCTPEILEDKFSRMDKSTYYDEAYVELGVGGGGGGFTGGAFGAFPGPAVVRKNGNCLSDPDERVGFPFVVPVPADEERSPREV